MRRPLNIEKKIMCVLENVLTFVSLIVCRRVWAGAGYRGVVTKKVWD